MIATSPDALLAHALGVAVEPRLGNHHAAMSPHDLYPCLGEDDWVAIAVGTELEWSALCALIGKPTWRRDYSSANQRAQASKDIDEAVRTWTLGLTATEAFLRLQEVGVPSSPSFTNKQIAEDPHIASRGVFVEVEHPVIGTQRVMRAPWLMASSDCKIRRHGPVIGQDNPELLEELLGTKSSPRRDWPTEVFE